MSSRHRQIPGCVLANSVGRKGHAVRVLECSVESCCLGTRLVRGLGMCRRSRRVIYRSETCCISGMIAMLSFYLTFLASSSSCH